MVIFNFIFDRDISLFSRVKRPSKSSNVSSTPLREDATQNTDDDDLTARGYADSDEGRLT
jgi:hypothetical protein